MEEQESRLLTFTDGRNPLLILFFPSFSHISAPRSIPQGSVTIMPVVQTWTGRVLYSLQAAK
jgi:hypothetical protein